MGYPIEKYKYAERILEDGSRQVIAISTYGGKTVKGVATCNPNDDYSLEAGKQLAAARCDLKVAAKRVKRAEQKREEALESLIVAENEVSRMTEYVNDAVVEVAVAESHLKALVDKY